MPIYPSRLEVKVTFSKILSESFGPEHPMHKTKKGKIDPNNRLLSFIDEIIYCLFGE